MPRIRVTAQVNGTTTLVVDEELGPIDYESGEKAVWGCDELPVKVPLDRPADFNQTIVPPANGLRVRLLEKGGPDGGGPRTPEATTRFYALRKDVVVDRDMTTGMHSTNTIDILFVFSGECGYELGDGTVITLRPGDIFINQGTPHAWRPHEGMCRIGAVLLGADRSGAPAGT